MGNNRWRERGLSCSTPAILKGFLSIRFRHLFSGMPLICVVIARDGGLRSACKAMRVCAIHAQCSVRELFVSGIDACPHELLQPLRRAGHA